MSLTDTQRAALGVIFQMLDVPRQQMSDWHKQYRRFSWSAIPIPVLDRLVVESVGGRISLTASPATRADQALGVIEHLRGEIRRHRAELLEIQDRLRGIGVYRTTTRIMDGLLWMTHPGSELAPLSGVVSRWRAEDAASG